MPGLEETLELDYSDALAGVDTVESALTGAFERATSTLSSSLSDSLDDVQAAADLAGDAIAEALSRGADQGAAAISDAMSGVDLEVGSIDIPVETNADEAVAELEDLASIAADASEPITLEVDASDVPAASAELDGLIAAEQEAAQPIVVDVDVSAVDDAAASMGDLAGDAGGASESVGGLEVAAQGAAGGLAGASIGMEKLAGYATEAGGAVSGIAPGFGVATIAGAAFAAGTEKIIGKAVGAEASTARFNRVLGDQAEEVLGLSNTIPGLSDDLATLTLRTGSAQSGLKDAAATFALTGQSAGFTREQIGEGSKQLLVLANYLAATNPKLGSADEIVGRLGSSLARGGRFAANFGLGFLGASQIGEKASEIFGKSADQLTFAEKQYAGLQLTFEKLGPSMAASIDEGVDQPIVKLRSLEVAINRILTAAGQGALDPLVDALEAAAPIAETVAESFGSLASGVLGTLSSEVTGLLGAITSVAGVLPGGLTTALGTSGQAALVAGGSYLAASKSLGLLFSLGQRFSGSLSKVATSLNLSGPAASLSNFAGGTQRAELRLRQFEEATVQSQVAQTNLATAVAAVDATVAEGAAVQAAYSAVLAEQASVTSAASAAVAADTEVRNARQAVLAGESGAQARLTAALAAQSAADLELGAANDRLSASYTRLATVTGVATEAQVAGAAETTVALEGQTAATTQVGIASKAATGSASGLAAALGPIAIVLGIAAAAYAIWSAATSDSTADVETATEALESYRDGLGLTAEELSTLPTAQARADFEESGEAADKFFNRLKDNDLVSDFNRLKLDLGEAGRGLAGNEAAARAFRQSLLDAGEVHIGVENGRATEEQMRRLEQQFVRTGDVADDAYSKMGGQGTNSRSHVVENPIAQAFRQEAEIAENTTKALVAKGEAEVRAKELTDDSAVATLAATGQLDLLGKQGEITARILLAKADAEQADADATRDNVVAQGLLAGQFGEVGDRAAAALQALQDTGSINPSGLEALRELANDPGFKSLPQETQDLVSAQLEAADSAAALAREQGEIIASTGEVASGYRDLADDLDAAIDRYLELSGAQARQDSSNRSFRQSLRDLRNDARQNGTGLDDTVAGFDAASISAQNYKSYLDLLPPSVRAAVDAATTAPKAPKRRAPRKGEAGGTALDQALGNAPGVTPGERDEEEGSSDPLADAQAKIAREEKAAALVRDYVSSHPSVDLTSEQQTANAQNADAFDAIADKIRKAAEESLKAGESAETTKAKILAMADQFEYAAVAAGFSQDAVRKFREEAHLTPETVSVDFTVSGIDSAAQRLDTLRTILGGPDGSPAGLLPPEVVTRILAIDDATKQTAAINSAIADLPQDQQIAIRAALDEGSPAAALIRLKELLHPVQVAVETGKLDQASADRAMADVQQFIDSHPNLEVKVDADTLTAVDSINKDFADRKATIEAEVKDPEERKRQIDQLTKDRTLAIKTLLTPDPTKDPQKLLDELKKPHTLDVSVNFTARGPIAELLGLASGTTGAGTGVGAGIGAVISGAAGRAKSVVGAGVSSAGEAVGAAAGGGGGGASAPAVGAGSIASQGDFMRAITAALPANPHVGQVAEAYGIRFRYTANGWVRIADQGGSPGQTNADRHGAGGLTTPLDRFAGGGLTGVYATGNDEDPLEDERANQAMETAVKGGSVRPAHSGLYPPGAYVAAEATTNGEWLLSRDPAYRAQNQQNVRMAARDLGVPLEPQVNLTIDQPRQATSVDMPYGAAMAGALAELVGITRRTASGPSPLVGGSLSLTLAGRRDGDTMLDVMDALAIVAERAGQPG